MNQPPHIPTIQESIQNVEAPLQQIQEKFQEGIQEPLKERLEELKENLPVVLNEIKDGVREASKFGADVLEAADPFIKPATEKVIDTSTAMAGKLGKSLVNIALNTAEAIPLVGVGIGAARSISNVGDALLAVGNSTAKTAVHLSEFVDKTTDNYDRLQQEKMDSYKRTNQTLEKFDNTSLPYSQTQSQLKMQQPKQKNPLPNFSFFQKKTQPGNFKKGGTRKIR